MSREKFQNSTDFFPEEKDTRTTQNGIKKGMDTPSAQRCILYKKLKKSSAGFCGMCYNKKYRERTL